MSLMDKLWVKNFAQGIGWADRENLPAPLKGRRMGKLACPLYSRLARTRRICLLGRIKRPGAFPGYRKGPIDCFTREHAVI